MHPEDEATLIVAAGVQKTTMTEQLGIDEKLGWFHDVGKQQLDFFQAEGV